MKLKQNLIYLFVCLFILISCKENNDLTPNPVFGVDMKDAITDDNNGGNNDNDNNGGDDNNGEDDDNGGDDFDPTKPYFRAKIDGVLESFSSRSIQPKGTGVEIRGEKGNSIEGILLSISSTLTEGDTVFFDQASNYAEYIGANYLSYRSQDGYVVFNKVTSLQVAGNFVFNASSSVDPTFRVTITDGEFLINR